MGAGEEGTPSKSSKPVSSAQEAPVRPATPMYPDWSTSMQAFYSAGGAPPFFASTVASPPPYMWGGQHPMMPPYGTPVPYPALYPPGGIYAHPYMATMPGAVQGTAEMDGKERSSSKKIKGTSANHGMISGKAVDGRKTASGSGNDGGTHSAESGSEGSSDASDENNNQDFSAAKKGSFDQMLADGANAQNNGIPTNFPNSIHGNPVGSVPATNLNIGMDLWNTTPAGSGPMRPNSVGVSQAVAPSGMINDQWTQDSWRANVLDEESCEWLEVHPFFLDERELKRQKRKQSNRESARRSRLRKQTECEGLQHKVEALSNENRSLRDELQRLSEDCEKLTAENNSVKEELSRLLGGDVVTNLENGNSDTHGDEGNC